jgi:signal peptidase I
VIGLGVAVAGIILCGVGLTVLRQRYVYATVSGESMTPALRPGDRVLVRRTPAERLRLGDVVVISPPTANPVRDRGLTGGDWVCKRVVALPGDPVPRNGFPALRGTADPVVPAGLLVVLGDLGERSQDSKQLGYFRAADLLGVVPFRSAGRRPSPA